MVTKLFPAAVAAFFMGPALAAAQAPNAPVGEAAVDPVAVQQAAPVPAAPAAPGVTFMGMVIVPDRSDRPVIQSVEPGSPAARAGLREDDLIEGVSREATPTLHEFQNSAIPLMRELDPGTKLTWHIARDGREVTVAIPRPSDRELGPPTALELQIQARQSGSLGMAWMAPPPPRPVVRHRPRVRNNDDRVFYWFYEGDSFQTSEEYRLID